METPPATDVISDLYVNSISETSVAASRKNTVSGLFFVSSLGSRGLLGHWCKGKMLIHKFQSLNTARIFRFAQATSKRIVQERKKSKTTQSAAANEMHSRF